MAAQKKPAKKPQASAEERQAALDNISAEDLAKIEAKKASTEGAYPIDTEWLLLAEFARAYGWEAYLDAKYDRRFDEDGERQGNLKVNLPEMLTLIEANRVLEYSQTHRDAQAVFIGSVSSRTKNPVKTFKSLIKNISNRIKVQE